MAEQVDIREKVRERYGAIAEGKISGCGYSEGAPTVRDIASAVGYRPEEIASAPPGANLGLGCGAPVPYAGIRQGETVLDLGSGAGFDAFLAMKEAGPGGRVIGVDMTSEMIEKARANAASIGAANVEFRLGAIEALPVADSSVDVILSNCVINLSPDKPKVFREAFRVLRPGGRMLVSDLVLVRPLPERIRTSVEAYVGCIAGASLLGDYLRFIREAGFKDVEVVTEGRYDVGDGSLRREEGIEEAVEAVRSVKVRAVRPA